MAGVRRGGEEGGSGGGWGRRGRKSIKKGVGRGKGQEGYGESFIFIKQRTAYEIRLSLVGSEMSIDKLPFFWRQQVSCYQFNHPALWSEQMPHGAVLSPCTGSCLFIPKIHPRSNQAQCCGCT